MTMSLAVKIKNNLRKKNKTLLKNTEAVQKLLPLKKNRERCILKVLRKKIQNLFSHKVLKDNKTKTAKLNLLLKSISKVKKKIVKITLKMKMKS